MTNKEENNDPLIEATRLSGVIADKIADGTLFNAGIYSRQQLAGFIRLAVGGWKMRAELARHSCDHLTAQYGARHPLTGSEAIATVALRGPDKP